jgi:transposase
MSRLTKLELTDGQRAALEHGYHSDDSHAFRTRCLMILLKAKKLPSWQIAEQVGCCMIVVNHWVKRYQEEGINGLRTKSGRGRKAILQREADLEQIRTAVQANRQRLSLAKAELESTLGKEFSTITLKRFLKKMTAVTNECENA